MDGDRNSPESVRTYLRDNPRELLETTREIVAADTRNPPGNTRELVDRLIDEFESLGFDCDRFGVDPMKPNVVATLPGADEFTLLYNGHVDTVPFTAAEWDRDPLGEIDGDRLYGRGTNDMKGAIGAMIQVARAYARTDTEPPVTLQFALVSDEEVWGDIGLADRLAADRLDPDACIVGEATGRTDVNSVAVGDRGYVWPTIEYEGRAAHGSRPVLGENAIDGLYEILRTCRRRLRELDVPTDGVDDEILAESVAYYACYLDEASARALFHSPTVNLGRFSGGDAVNTVPSSARADLDVRVLPTVDPEAIVSRIRDCLEDREAATITDIAWTAGSYTDPESAIVRATTDVVEDVVPTPVYRRFATGGGDAQVFRDAGVPTVEFATGTGTAHAVDEYTTVDKLLRNAIAYAQVPFAIDRERDG
ncbi:M20/M25/M40 family metallo-hydrolase [Haloterrigena salifodinae]|uniref:M20/M25/M40 family metallo-hydrolase n=1 Tax=Haloterrigena salifodinae TaxID=2675099 RepID=A0A8T8E0T6_9EURY|nr:M20/M25/M40 family metallo-hydrolase [Haloterrigena salifodinae]QRV15425.1 M20/M25/M40 family metallo-hydrolase [Haloterrigena salifodinae]